MKSKIPLVSLFLSFCFITSAAYAGALTVSPDVSKSLTENEQITVTITVTNPSGTETNIVTELSSSPTWFSVVQSCSTINTLSASQSSTSTCIIKPTSTGSGFTLTARSEPQSGSSNSGTGSASGINVASQSSSLSASVSGPSSVGTSETFYIGATVAAPSSNDVTNARATISRSGQCEIDTADVPAQQSLGNITKGTTKSVTNWKLSSSSASGTCTVTVNVVSDVGGSASPSKSITVGTTGGGNSGGSSGSAGGAAGGAGGAAGGAAAAKVTTQRGKATITVPSIAAGKMATAVIEKTQDVAVEKIEITVKNSVNNIQLVVSKLDSRPSSVVREASGNVYHYIEITKANISSADINKTKINFKIEKSWIDANSIDEATVALQRYDELKDEWERLATVKNSSDSENVYYEAEFSGLSLFAISGDVKAGAEQPSGQQTGEQPEEKPSGILENLSQGSSLIVFAALALAAIAAVIIFRKRIFR